MIYRLFKAQYHSDHEFNIRVSIYYYLVYIFIFFSFCPLAASIFSNQVQKKKKHCNNDCYGPRSSREAYHILMVRMIDPTTFHEQYVSVIVLPQHFYGGQCHFAQRRLVSLRSLGARV